jgi:hypothetical protein
MSTVQVELVCRDMAAMPRLPRHLIRQPPRRSDNSTQRGAAVDGVAETVLESVWTRPGLGR